MTTLTLRQTTLAKLHEIRIALGRPTLDAALTDLLNLHDSLQGAQAINQMGVLHKLTRDLDRGISAIAILLQEQLKVAFNLERGAVAYNIEMGNLLANALVEIAPAKREDGR